jgi:hypothetical protein
MCIIWEDVKKSFKVSISKTKMSVGDYISYDVADTGYGAKTCIEMVPHDVHW